MAYARPVLCRLCRFPAPDGGVRVSEVDREKLSEWCLRMMDTTLDEERLEKAVFCPFCVASARFEQQFSRDSGDESVGWWKSKTNLSHLDKFYLGDEIQPCFVQIEHLSAKQIEKLTKGSSTVANKLKTKPRRKKINQCVFCLEKFSSFVGLKNHATQSHKDKLLFWCHFCSKMLKTRKQKRVHFRKNHKDKYLCIYCGVRYKQSRPYSIHMENCHREEAIQCKFSRNCTLYFRTQAEKEQHIQERHMMNKVKCTYCSKFITPIAMANHVRLCHRQEAIRCDNTNCQSYFKDKVKHVAEVHLGQRGDVECIYCNKIFALGATLGEHIKKCHKTEAIKCNFNRMCPNYFRTDEERQQHIRDVHEARLLTSAQCIYCQKVFADSISLFSHMKNLHSRVMIKCTWFGCRQYFHSNAERDAHFDQSHAAEDQKNTFRCQMCPFKTFADSLLKTHILSRHGVEKLQCSQCPQVLKSKLALKLHMRSKHIPKLECSVCLKKIRNLPAHLRKKKCPGCDFVSKCLSENSQHRKICTKKHKCQLCEKTFEQKVMRDNHILRAHVPAPSTREYEKDCYFCKRKFSSREKLAKHNKSPKHLANIKNAPFTCDFCQKPFLSLLRISVHISNFHLKESSPISCPTCGKTFSRKSFLKKHCNDVHYSEKKLVKCDLCDATLRDISLRRHRMTAHKIFQKNRYRVTL